MKVPSVTEDFSRLPSYFQCSVFPPQVQVKILVIIRRATSGRDNGASAQTILTTDAPGCYAKNAYVAPCDNRFLVPGRWLGNLPRVHPFIVVLFAYVFYSTQILASAGGETSWRFLVVKPILQKK